MVYDLDGVGQGQGGDGLVTVYGAYEVSMTYSFQDMTANPCTTWRWESILAVERQSGG
jgi:hypothetical protein